MDPRLHKLYALLLISMLGVSIANPVDVNCGSCGKPPKKPIKSPPVVVPPIIKPPVTLPPVTLPPVTLPPVLPPAKPPKKPIKSPPVVVPPIIKPPVTLPPVTLPPVTLPPVTVPPIIMPPVTVPPAVKPPAKPCPTPAPPATCPIDTLKLGGCVDLLGGLVHIGLGDPVVNKCCPILAGLVEMEAAVCLCTTLKEKLLNLTVFVPLAFQLLVTCGKNPPPGFTCTI